VSRLLLDLGPDAWVERCASTQELCRQRASEGAPEGTAVAAWEQSAGRGRNERPWHSPPGLGLWMSFVLRPVVDVALWPALTALTALSVAEAADDLLRGAGGPGGFQAAVKWPNDVWGIRGKLAGILAETAGGGLVVGVGLNLGQTVADFPPPLRDVASSLRIEGAVEPPPPARAALAVNECLTGNYRRYQNGDRSFLQDRLRGRFLRAGARVRVGWRGPDEPDRAVPVAEGLAVDIGPSGELVLEEGGQRLVVSSGEVLGWEHTDRGGVAPRPGGAGGGGG